MFGKLCSRIGDTQNDVNSAKQSQNGIWLYLPVLMVFHDDDAHIDIPST